MVPPIDGARGFQKEIVPELKVNESEFDRRFFSYKEIACALQYLYVKLVHQKTRICRFLGALLNLFLNAPPLLHTESYVLGETTPIQEIKIF